MAAKAQVRTVSRRPTVAMALEAALQLVGWQVQLLHAALADAKRQRGPRKRSGPKGVQGQQPSGTRRRPGRGSR